MFLCQPLLDVLDTPSNEEIEQWLAQKHSPSSCPAVGNAIGF